MAERKYQAIINQMSLEEKCAMLSGGETFATRKFERYGIPSMQLSDGPHGLRKQDAGANHLGLGGSVAATCFPTAATVANSWDPALGELIGEAIGEEAAAQEVSVVLGPGLNMKRNPLCGRNFEYFSEDPYLAGKLAAGYIRGIQKNGLSACPKHFAANNQELQRMASDSILDERTFREIYLTGFEIAVKEGKPKSIMSAYNLINGVYANENPHLLQDILKKEWGFNGIVVTDWGGSNDHAKGVACGSTLEMPAPGGDSIRELKKAVEKKTLKERDVDDRLEELLELIYETQKVVSQKTTFSVEHHHQIARRAAEESLVLLKNEDHFLPLKKGSKVAVIGDFAETPRYQGAGSSIVNPTKLDTILNRMDESELEMAGFAKGFCRQDKEDRVLLQEAENLAGKADFVLFCMGLDEMKESEGLDRKNMQIAANQIRALQAVEKVNHNVVVILSAGSAVEMPWLENCRALLFACLGGQAGAGAVLDALTGKINPSGKLAETYPIRYEDTPSCHSYPGKAKTSEYREGIYIGYRYYDTAGLEVTFPFGYGLSYTGFAYSKLTVDRSRITCVITNTGDCDGAEIVQLYVHRAAKNDGHRIFRPEKELKGFRKVFLKAGESKPVTIELDEKAFRFYNCKKNCWETEGGTWQILVGAGSRDIRLTAELEVEGTQENPYQGTNLPSYESGKVSQVSDEEFSRLLGHEIPQAKLHGMLDRNVTFGQLIHGRSPIGWIVWCVLTLMLRISEKSGKPNLNLLFIYNMPLRALAKMTGGGFSMGMVDGLVMEMNGFWVIGLLRTLFEALKNIVGNAALEKRLQG